MVKALRPFSLLSVEHAGTTRAEAVAASYILPSANGCY